MNAPRTLSEARSLALRLKQLRAAHSSLQVESDRLLLEIRRSTDEQELIAGELSEHIPDQKQHHCFGLESGEVVVVHRVAPGATRATVAFFELAEEAPLEVSPS